MYYTYLLTPWSRVILEKLTGSAASQEIPRIFGTRRFLTIRTSACHLSLSWANSIQFPQPPPTSWRSIWGDVCTIQNFIWNQMQYPLKTGQTFIYAVMWSMIFTVPNFMKQHYVEIFYTEFHFNWWLLVYMYSCHQV